MERNLSETEKLQKREREINILNTIARELSTSLNLAHALNVALTQVADLLGLNTGWIFLIDEKNGESYLAATLNLPPALEENPQRMKGYCYCLELYQMGNLKSAENINVITCSRLYRLVDGTDGLRFHASIPINVNEKRLGVMNVASTDWCELSSDDLKILYTIGDLLGIAIERSRFFEKSGELGAMEERYRIAREIHDTLGQGLAAIILRLETIDALLEAGKPPEAIRKTVADTLGLSRLNLEEARRAVQGLRTPSLDNHGLSEAIADLVSETEKSAGLKIKFIFSEENSAIPSFIEAGIFRVVQEGLTNIVKHARAKNVSVSLAIDKKTLSLTLSDDGKGFLPEEIPQGRHGLTGINERVKLLNGAMTLESTPGKGTRLELSVPLGNKQ